MTDEETFPRGETKHTWASQSKNSGHCPDQNTPVSLASWSYSYIVGSIVGGAEFRSSLAKTETEAYGEVLVCKKPRTSLTSQSMESRTNQGCCSSSSLSDTREMEIGNEFFYSREC